MYFLAPASPEAPSEMQIVTAVGDQVLTADGTFEMLPGQAVELVPPWAHVVRSGETMWSISRLYSVTVTDLRAWNPGVVPTAMPVGTVLRVRDPLVSP
jgi:LysM repeat protein